MTQAIADTGAQMDILSLATIRSLGIDPNTRVAEVGYVACSPKISTLCGCKVRDFFNLIFRQNSIDAYFCIFF